METGWVHGLGLGMMGERTVRVRHRVPRCVRSLEDDGQGAHVPLRKCWSGRCMTSKGTLYLTRQSDREWKGMAMVIRRRWTRTV